MKDFITNEAQKLSISIAKVECMLISAMQLVKEGDEVKIPLSDKEKEELEKTAYLKIENDDVFRPYWEQLKKKGLEKEKMHIYILESAKADIMALKKGDEIEVKKQEKKSYLRKHIIYPIIIAILVAASTNVISDVIQFRAYTKKQVFDADYKRATELIEKLTKIQLSAILLRDEVGIAETNGRMIQALASSYYKKANDLMLEFYSITNNIPNINSSKVSYLYAKSFIELNTFVLALEAIENGGTEREIDRVNKILYELIDFYYISEGIITKEQGEGFKDSCKVVLPAAINFDPRCLGEFSTKINNELFEKLGSNIF